jgi:hypothetical protein
VLGGQGGQELLAIRGLRHRTNVPTPTNEGAAGMAGVNGRIGVRDGELGGQRAGCASSRSLLAGSIRR